MRFFGASSVPRAARTCYIDATTLQNLCVAWVLTNRPSHHRDGKTRYFFSSFDHHCENSALTTKEIIEQLLTIGDTVGLKAALEARLDQIDITDELNNVGFRNLTLEMLAEARNVYVVQTGDEAKMSQVADIVIRSQTVDLLMALDYASLGSWEGHVKSSGHGTRDKLLLSKKALAVEAKSKKDTRFRRLDEKGTLYAILLSSGQRTK